MSSCLFATTKSIDAYKRVQEFLDLRLNRFGRHRTRVQDFATIHLVALVNNQVVAILCCTRGSTRLCRRLVYLDFSLVRERRERLERHKRFEHLKILKQLKILVRLRSQAIVCAFLLKEHIATISNARDAQFDKMNAKFTFVQNEDCLQHHLERSYKVKRQSSSLSRDLVYYDRVLYVSARFATRDLDALRERATLIVYNSRVYF